MFVTIDEFRPTWNQIKQQSLSHSTCRIVVFVSCLDVDALCAAKILDILLQKDLIPHKIVPVVGYESLRESFLQLDSDIKNLICIGCGANVDLEEFFGLDGLSPELQPAARPRIHVMDKHRPWNLDNLFGNELVLCYDDGGLDEIRKYKEAYDYLASLPDSEDEADIDSSQSDGIDAKNFNDTNNNGSHSPSSQGNDDLSDNETQRDAVQQTGDGVAGKLKRKRSDRTEYESILQSYYEQGSFVNSTDSVEAYLLLSKLGETTLRSLWLTIVGATSIEPQHPGLYALLHPTLQDEIQRLTRARDAKRRTAGQSKRDVSFTTEPDYSLFLLRQWSLYESMIHSPFLSAKLYLWKEDGRKTLHKMLARIGITLHDAKESWIHMKPSLKRDLRDKLESVSGLYGIEGINRDGVVRRFGLDGTISAGDAAESIAALLEAGDPDAFLTNFEEKDTNKREFWVENFWVAWDALENFQRLSAGAEQAKSLQRAVVATGTAIFEKSIPKDLHAYRMVVVQDGPDLSTFRNPLSLARLGVWIAEGCAEMHARVLPLVLATPDKSRDVFLVLGMAPFSFREATRTTSSGVNKFGHAFQLIASKISARVRIDAFESSIIEVAKDDLLRFLQALDTELRTEKETSE